VQIDPADMHIALLRSFCRAKESSGGLASSAGGWPDGLVQWQEGPVGSDVPKVLAELPGVTAPACLTASDAGGRITHSGFDRSTTAHGGYETTFGRLGLGVSEVFVSVRCMRGYIRDC
jgi:hypothetical protein